MMEAVFNFEEIEDPPSPLLGVVKSSFSKLLKGPLFSGFNKPTMVSIVFVKDPQMQELNHQFRGKDSTTDVLTFPLNEKLEKEYLLGEIVISMDKAKTDSELFGISVYREIMMLLVHGITHLLGYDHKNDQQELEMKEIENKLMNQISLSEGIDVHE